MLVKETNISIDLPVMEAFYTLQGEGFHQGRAAYFIRLGGCDVGCFWCDVKESWNGDAHTKQPIRDIVAAAVSAVGQQSLSERQALAVITGGEPLLHNLDDLTLKLRAAGFETNIETSGSSPLTGVWNWICLSPKKFKPPLPGILAVANELKMIIYNRNDFAWAEKYAMEVGEHCRLYLQPEWSKAGVVTPMIVDYIKAHPKWKLCLQIHKYINVP